MTALTIGNFDGVHRGHQLLFDHLRKTGLKTIALTFSNHSSEILKGSAPPLLNTTPLKTALLEEYVDEAISIPFTETLANQSFEEFLSPYTMSYLILGEDAAFGKNRLGTPDALRALGKQRGFQVQIISKLCIDHKPISSTRIRELIAQGNLAKAEELLGRPHCFYYTGSMDHLALPPDGRYAVWSLSKSGLKPIELMIQNQKPILSSKRPQLISFSPNINPSIYQKLCQTSPAVS